jgi:hypothetical protein
MIGLPPPYKRKPNWHVVFKPLFAPTPNQLWTLLRSYGSEGMAETARSLLEAKQKLTGGPLDGEFAVIDDREIHKCFDVEAWKEERRKFRDLMK